MECEDAVTDQEAEEEGEGGEKVPDVVEVVEAHPRTRFVVGAR